MLFAYKIYLQIAHLSCKIGMKLILKTNYQFGVLNLSKEEIYKLKKELEKLIYQNMSKDKIRKTSSRLDRELEKFLFENLGGAAKHKK